MIKLFTHTDLDGVGCAVLAEIYFFYSGRHTLDITYCGYEEVDSLVRDFNKNTILQDGDFCFITDISVSEAVAQEIEDGKNKGKIFLLDHHKTALGLNKYNWCTVREKNKLTGIKTCGTELFYEFIRNNSCLTHKCKQFVDLVRDYDTWRWVELGEEGVICKNVNDLLYLYGRRRFIDWCLEEISQDTFPLLRQSDKVVLDINQRKIDEYIENKDRQLFVKNISGHTCGIVYADKYFSELGNKICVMHPEIDFVAMIDVGSKKISYRTVKEDIDLGEIAKKFGGGGHPKASGSHFNEIELMNIAKCIFGCELQ